MSTQAVATTRTQETPPQALQRILDAGKKQLAIAVGEAMNPDRMIRLAVTALHQTPALQNCSMVSIANSVMLAAQLRLEINTGLGHAWLIPYNGQCTFQVGYRGLIELAHRSSEVHDVMAHLVHGKDFFELEYGDTPHCMHRPVVDIERGEWIGAYARIRYKEGPPSTLFMHRSDIEAVRDKSSQSKNSDHGPWKRFTDEMIRKTPTKRHLKYVRLSVNDLARAIGLDDQAEAATSTDAPEAPRDPSRLQQELVLEGDVLEMSEEATHELKGSIAQQEEVAQEKLTQKRTRQPRTPVSEMPVASAPSGDPQRDQFEAAVRETDNRRKLFAQLNTRLGEDAYRVIVNEHGGALNYETFQALSAAVDRLGDA